MQIDPYLSLHKTQPQMDQVLNVKTRYPESDGRGEENNPEPTDTVKDFLNRALVVQSLRLPFDKCQKRKIEALGGVSSSWYFYGNSE